MLRHRALCDLAGPRRHHHDCSRAPLVDIASVQNGPTSSPSLVPVTIRGRVKNSRIRGKLAFIQVRQPPFDSIQVVASGAEIARQVKTITPESIVDVTGTIVRAERPVTSVSCSNYELHAERVDVVSKAESPLPFPINDCHTKLDTRLNHRVIDMRTSLMAAVPRVVSTIAQSFRSQLLSRDFVEIHTPKLVATASEGGSAVFALDYFGRPAYLAQSPQLYKQMALMGDAMRVFEIGPVFRAEKSLTHRHLTEFIGLDAEFVIRHSVTEVMDVLETVVCGMIDELQGEHAALVRRAQEALNELDVAGDDNDAVTKRQGDCEQDGEENMSLKGMKREDRKRAIVCEVSEETLAAYNPLMTDTAELLLSTDRYHGRVGGGGSGSGGDRNNKTSHSRRVLRLAFDDAVRLLVDHDGTPQSLTDFTLPQERRLGELVRERYGVDVYVVDEFPAAARPFYTMPHPRKAGLTCGFDMYLRGEEICSGAQRIHDPALLLRNMERLRVDGERLKDYVDALRYGAWPHGGFGIGLERIVCFLLGARDVRQISLFPRDPKRLTP